MTRNQAIEKYLNHQVHAAEQIRRLMGWDPNLSIVENSVKLRISHYQGRTFDKTYKIKHDVVGSGHNYKGLKNV